MQSLNSDVLESLRACSAHAMRGEHAQAAWQSGWAACAKQIHESISEKRVLPKESTMTTTARLVK